MAFPANPRLDERLLRALGDPTRQRVVTLLNERVATASEIARELAVPEREVASHLGVLLANDAIERCADEPTDSGESWYRATIRPFLDDEHWAQLPSPIRHALFAQNIRLIIEHLGPVAEAGGLEDPRTHISLTRLELDKRGWAEVADLLGGVLEEIMDIHAESVDRLTRGEATEMVASELVVLHFQRAARDVSAAADQTCRSQA